MNKNSSIVIFFLFTLIILTGHAATQEGGDQTLVQGQAQRQRAMTIGTLDEARDNNGLSKNESVLRAEFNAFLSFLVSRGRNGSIPINLSKIDPENNLTFQVVMDAIRSTPSDQPVLPVEKGAS